MTRETSCLCISYQSDVLSLTTYKQKVGAAVQTPISHVCSKTPLFCVRNFHSSMKQSASHEVLTTDQNCVESDAEFEADVNQLGCCQSQVRYAEVNLARPYLTLPYREDVLPPSAEASNGPNAHPQINRKVTKSPSAVLTWVHTNTWNHPPPKWGPTHFDLPTNTHSQYPQENVNLKTQSTSILVNMTSRTPNKENPGDPSPNRA